MSTTQKHRNFVSEPMGAKSVKSLAGIGDTLGQRLENQGFQKASSVLGQYLVMNKDEGLFKDWLKDTCQANAKQSNDCYTCVRDWSDAFL